MNLRRQVIGALIGCASLALLANPATTQEAGYFSFKICNKSKEKASVAIAARENPDSDKFVIRGWTEVDPDACADAGTFSQGEVYHYAQAGDSEWTGKDMQLCVDIPGPMDRQVDDKKTCDENELKSFDKTFIEANIGTFTWTLDP